MAAIGSAETPDEGLGFVGDVQVRGKNDGGMNDPGLVSIWVGGCR